MAVLEVMMELIVVDIPKHGVTIHGKFQIAQITKGAEIYLQVNPQYKILWIYLHGVTRK